jgi:hypothetical protein
MMKLTALLVAATFAIPTVALAEGMQNNNAQQQKSMQKSTGAADSSVPGATNPNTSNAPAKAGTTGAPARDSSVPGATNPNTSNAPAKKGATGAPAADSSVPGASKK